MKTKIIQRNEQTLAINPTMRYFLQLLAVGKQEFIEALKNEVDSNPMLTFSQKEAKEDFLKKINRLNRSESFSFRDQLFFRRDPEIDKNRAIENLTRQEISLPEHLLRQAHSTFSLPAELKIAEYIIYNLRPNGYLNFEISTIASSFGSSVEEVERIREIIKNFEPAGCASLTLKECLLAQITESPQKEKLKILISNHLEDIAHLEYQKITNSLQISLEELEELIKKIKKLNPLPGLNYYSEPVEYADIDFIAIADKNGNYKVIYLDDDIPTPLLSSYYDQMLNQQGIDDEIKKFLNSSLKNAQFFLDSIQMRKRVLIDIVEKLVKIQKDFLNFGEKWKKPLTMKELARELNINESTVSRAIANKFIAYEKGILSLKTFFTHGIKGTQGFSHSVEIVKQKIKDIIAAETPDNILSDQDIVQKLKELGIQIARRTVRNYREQLKIPALQVRKKKYLNNFKGEKNEHYFYKQNHKIT